MKVPGWAKRTLPVAVKNTHRLKLDAFDLSSGSEFEPEEEEEEEAATNEDVEEEDEEERQAWAEFIAARAARAQNKVRARPLSEFSLLTIPRPQPRPRPPTAREQVEVLFHSFYCYASNSSLSLSPLIPAARLEAAQHEHRRQ